MVILASEPDAMLKAFKRSIGKEMQSPQRATTFWILTLVLSRAVMQSFGCLPSENSKKVLGTE